MAIRPLIQTECYKCGAELMAHKDDVHPLCVTCEADFDDWFNKQLTLFDKDN